MIASAAAAILESLVERKTIESKVMIVVAHPDDETIGMGAQLCRFSDALLVHVTDGAPRDGRDANAHGYSSTAEYPAARHAVTTLTLTATDRLRKKRMIDCFASQHELLAGFAVETESFREAPQYNFTQPPHRGELHYERLGWKINGVLCRKQARLALDRLGLPACRSG
jgi:LmbE family N-acetylglucosaminyl deacetylase